MPKSKSYGIDMCSGPILKKMLFFALPLMCSGVLQLLFNAADVIVVGRYAGDNSMAAVGSNAALINLLTNLFIGLSVGANVLAARYFGAKREQELRATVHTAMLLALCSGAALIVVGVAGARQVLIWMQAPPGVLDLAALYLRIFFLGMPAMMLYNFGAALLRAKGDTRRPLYFLLLSGVVNVALNLLLVIVFHLDVAGVAIATVVSQCISAALVVICLMRETGGFRLELKALRFQKDQLAGILRVGLPAGVQGVIFSLSNVVIQSSINSLGEVVMAGSAASANIEGFVYAAMNAVYQATLSFSSQNAGAGRLDRINRILLTGQGCVTATGLVLGVGAWQAGRILLGIYTQDPAVIEAGFVRLGIVCAPYAICGMMDTMVGALRGIGYSVMPMTVSLIGACVLRLVWIATVFRIPEYHTPECIYWSYPISWAITLLAHIFCYVWAKRRTDLRFAAAKAQRKIEQISV
ncbi:MatE efflux family protein [Oscillibacter valericigenes Sjm18-20]|nr:MatE efflux family protein [Oscillibacter valericigenes Sjm18-20]